ncbi:MAG: cytochrome oxidase assembly protein [Planctomycetes bacterium]|nr:cytochrome oxidase assembly protein [Planctomycetota bacterium]
MIETRPRSRADAIPPQGDGSWPRSRSAWPARLSACVVAATFPLIWVGGLVTTYDAGMAVEDWPGTYGYNLFLYPWTTWWAGPFDLFIEHGHRLLGALVGVLTIGLAAVTFACDPRASARGAAVGALVLVCLQGGLGGLRVLLDARALAMAHGCVGPAFLAYAVAMSVHLVPSRARTGSCESGRSGAGRVPLTGPAPERAPLKTAALATAFVYLQLILGAYIRHIPVDASVNAFRFAVLFHLALAVVVFAYALALAWSLRRARSGLRLLAASLGAATVAQPGLGAAVWVVKYGWPFGLSETYAIAGSTIVANSFWQAMTVTAHVAIGSAILGISTAITAVLARRSGWGAAAVVEPWTVVGGAAR